jgi:hypothetical protein
MKKLLTTCSALVLGAALVTGCSEEGGNRLGENPSGDRTPAASPPTSPAPARPDTMPGGTTTTPGGTTGTRPGATPPSSGTTR